ncbi:MAG: accessory factor UbiK family protein [Rhodospirillaceae bacterium]|jgi:BMFP domain-containing protein YqiC|nr:accessory factor UbiK family protein [Rhodospirillaceae bacterium]MBT5660322.1 accessory factor UbiK family protein [Rhodospirillaceae bacterium]MBT5751976.1 accessory factor UbiK family protein [Rhodospirillaceae bacterium]
MQTRNRILDDVARVAGGAMSAMTGLAGEVEAVVRKQLERALSKLDMVSREEFEAVKAMASRARQEQETLAKRLDGLEKTSPKRVAAVKAKPAAKGKKKRD